jgi:hypothetical protein
MTRRFFNIAGPCQPDIHYMLPPTHRLPDVLRIVDQRGYFVLHAPRQTGKTTTMLALARELTISGRYTALLVSMETGAAFDEDIAAAELAILDTWQKKAEDYLPHELRPPSWPDAPAGHRLGSALRAWAKQSTRPLVLFLDEIDALRNQTLISVLRQLRNGYYDRPHSFPWSLALIGLRDVRDYKVASGGSDHFNIKVGSFLLSDFTLQEVIDLLAQHTEDTGQSFTPEAVQMLYELTVGQPWLVNALAHIITQFLLPNSDKLVTLQHIQEAKQILITWQVPYLNELRTRSGDPQVQQVADLVLRGKPWASISLDSRQEMVDWGMIKRFSGGGFVPANPVYAELLRFGIQ